MTLQLCLTARQGRHPACPGQRRPSAGGCQTGGRRQSPAGLDRCGRPGDPCRGHPWAGTCRPAAAGSARCLGQNRLGARHYHRTCRCDGPGSCFCRLVWIHVRLHLCHTARMQWKLQCAVRGSCNAAVPVPCRVQAAAAQTLRAHRTCPPGYCQNHLACAAYVGDHHPCCSWLQTAQLRAAMQPNQCAVVGCCALRNSFDALPPLLLRVVVA
jgi:hypothetical protein